MDSEFALIKSKKFQLFLPKIDKELLRNSKDFASIDELIDHYENIFDTYDRYIGLDNSSYENQQSKNRYFLKADTHGAGGAYYGPIWTANSKNNTTLWLNKISWGALHEIAHGYQADFRNRGISTGEVSNNLLAAQYQYDQYGKEADRFSWLFNNGKREVVDNNLYQRTVVNGEGYSALDLRSQLVLLTMLKQKAGTNTYAKLYQGYRKLVLQPDVKKETILFSDLMNKYYSETTGLDFTPALNKWEIQTSNFQDEINRYQNYEAVASLVNIVPSNQLANARKLVDPTILMNSNFELVNNKDIAPLGLEGDIEIHLAIDDINILKGETLKLKEGSHVIQEVEIDQENIHFYNVPNGVYTVGFSNESNEYKYSGHYVHIKEKNNEATIEVEKLNSSKLMNQTIKFFGLSNYTFANFETDINNETATFSVISNTPHAYFAKELYASIKVFDENNQVIYSKEIEGINAQVVKDVIPLKLGYRVVLFHAETKNRLTNEEGIIDSTSKTNSFKMTKLGLQNEIFKNDLETTLINKITEQASQIGSSEIPKDTIGLNGIKQLFMAINALSEPNRLTYLEKYKDLFERPLESPNSKAIVEVTTPNLNEEQFPEEPIGPPSGSGNFTINAVSDFKFDKIQIGQTAKAQVEVNKKLGIEVIDKRGTGGGWNVQVAISDFVGFTKGQEIALKGWQLMIPKGTITSKLGDLSALPESKKVVINAPNTPQFVFSAEKDHGLGTYSSIFMDEQTSFDQAVRLFVPTYGKIGQYKSELTWLLIDGPIK
nr:putative mucin/carbohydrate-binding domain-containing protein [Enterococcus sp. DIV0212c]